MIRRRKLFFRKVGTGFSGSGGLEEERRRGRLFGRVNACTTKTRESVPWAFYLPKWRMRSAA